MSLDAVQYRLSHQYPDAWAAGEACHADDGRFQAAVDAERAWSLCAYWLASEESAAAFWAAYAAAAEARGAPARGGG